MERILKKGKKREDIWVTTFQSPQGDWLSGGSIVVSTDYEQSFLFS